MTTDAAAIYALAIETSIAMAIYKVIRAFFSLPQHKPSSSIATERKTMMTDKELSIVDRIIVYEEGAPPIDEMSAK